MLGGPGHTSLVGSKLNFRGPTSGASVVAGFFFLPATALSGASAHNATTNTTAKRLRLRIELKRKRYISISIVEKRRPSQRLAMHYFPGRVVSFMFSRFLWQLSQNAMLFTWSLISRSGCAEACGWWQDRQLSGVLTFD